MNPGLRVWLCSSFLASTLFSTLVSAGSLFAIQSVASPDQSSSNSTRTVAAPVPKSVPDDFPPDLKTRDPRSIDELKMLESRVQQVLEKVSPATVSLSNGSGVVVSEDGYVLTAAHVNMKAGRRVRITFADGKRAWGETMGNNHRSDFGLVKITSEGKWPFVEMGSSAELKPGHWSVAVGFPVTFARGAAPSVRLGRVLRSSKRSIMTDCTIMGGDSGGPLFNLEGQVVGIHSRVNDSIIQNFHIPVDAYSNNWDRLVKAEDWNQIPGRGSRRGERRDSESRNTDRKPAYLGVRRTAGTPTALISSVTNGSAADRAGVQPGDVVVRFNDNEVGSFDQLVKLVAEKRAGDRVRLLVNRNQKLLQLSFRLGSR